MRITPEHRAQLEKIGAKVGRVFSGEWGWIVQLQKRDVWILLSTESGEWWVTDSRGYASVWCKSPREGYTEYLRACARRQEADAAWLQADAANVAAELARIGDMV